MNIFEGRKTYRCPHCGDDSVFPGYKTCSSCGGAVSGKAKEVKSGPLTLRDLVSCCSSILALGLIAFFFYFLWVIATTVF
jgi:hypothetical protein